MSSVDCPICQSPTGVTETRQSGGGLRRRRRCSKLGCDGRLTTYEVPAVGKRYRSDETLVLVPVVELKKLLAVAKQLHEFSNHSDTEQV